MKSSKYTRALIEGAMMVALATVLSIFKVVDMPYGGSVTIASMLPIVILSYRHGPLWGLGGGLVYAAVEQLLGLKNLSYFTTWQSILAVIFLDYILAFTLVGLGGIFKKAFREGRMSLAVGALSVSLIRYICHVISGATVWAGLSIPSSAAIIYSLGYNATYMLPETIVLTAVAYYLGGVIDFDRHIPTRKRAKTGDAKEGSYLALSGLCFLVGIVSDIAIIAPALQNPESGAFDFSGISNIAFIPLGIITALSLGLGILFLILAKINSEKTRKSTSKAETP